MDVCAAAVALARKRTARRNVAGRFMRTSFELETTARMGKHRRSDRTGWMEREEESQQER